MSTSVLINILHILISECLLNHKLKRFCGLNIPFSALNYKVINYNNVPKNLNSPKRF